MYLYAVVLWVSKMLNLNLSLPKLVTLNVLYLVFYCGIIFIYVNTDHCIVLCVPSI